MAIFTLRGAHLNCAIMAMLYTHSIGNQRRTRWWCLKCVIVYLARDIRPFVMYCVNGKPRSSLLIESTDSMIYSVGHVIRIRIPQIFLQFRKSSGSLRLYNTKNSNGMCWIIRTAVSLVYGEYQRERGF